MSFLLTESKHDNSKVDEVQDNKKHETLIQDIVEHYQKIHELDAKISKRSKHIIPKQQMDLAPSDSTELMLDFDLDYILNKYPSSISKQTFNQLNRMSPPSLFSPDDNQFQLRKLPNTTTLTPPSQNVNLPPKMKVDQSRNYHQTTN